MRRVVWMGVMALAMVVFPAGAASGQGWQAGPPGEDLGSIAVLLGATMPRTTMPDGTSHETGIGGGMAATWWALRHVGLRASVMRATTAAERSGEGLEPSLAAEQEPTVWHYGIELALRYPMVGQRVSWFPYLSGGPGAKSYRWSIDRPRIGDSTTAWSVGGGVDLRPGAAGRFGMVLDVRHHQSRYKWHGLGFRAAAPDFESYGPVLSDLILTWGLSVNR